MKHGKTTWNVDDRDDERHDMKPFLPVLLLLLAAGERSLLSNSSDQVHVLPVMEMMDGIRCLSEIGIDLQEVRPGKNAFYMTQRGLGWNRTDYYISLTVDVHYTGEFMSEGGGRTESINKTSKLQVKFEPRSEGHFESTVNSVFRLHPRPGWEVEGTIIPSSARCSLWSERPTVLLSEDRRNVVLRSGR